MREIDGFLAARDFLLKHREDPETAYRDFRWPELRNFNWALDYFDRLAEDNDQAGLWIVEETGSETKLSFDQLRRRSNQVANHLRKLGLRRGERILLMLGNVVPLWETMLAAMKLGAVLIPSTTLLGRDDLSDRIARGRVGTVIAPAAEAGKFTEIAASLRCIAVGGEAPGWQPYEEAYGASEGFAPDGPTAGDDPLLLYFTSGTTAKAKLVLHTHRSYPVGHLSTMHWLGLRPGDIHLNISSPGWAKHAWSCFFAPWNAGATVFIHAAKRFNARDTLQSIARHGVTTLCAPPTVWRLFVQEDLKSYPMRLTAAASAGEPLNPEVIETVREAWNLEIRDGYGQTETTAQIGNPPGLKVKPGSMGRALPGYRVALLDPDGQEAQEGEIALDLAQRPLGLMPGYEDDPKRSREIMAGNYYRTGDVAARDADGYITFIGRADDVFKAADYRISPFELESVLIEHAAVAEAAVVPSPDPIRLAVPKAYVMLAPGWEPSRETARAIFGHVREHISPFKRVRRLEFAELPKTISGKIRRVDLRRREVERRGGPTPQAPGTRAPNEYWAEDFPDLQ
ncbi:MAG TPA: AMP-binding protein [Candidatus Udaeobacter sp.]|nr:AMP-binding protein [Candidatus Udaeobacter sp.]